MRAHLAILLMTAVTGAGCTLEAASEPEPSAAAQDAELDATPFASQPAKGPDLEKAARCMSARSTGGALFYVFAVDAAACAGVVILCDVGYATFSNECGCGCAPVEAIELSPPALGIKIPDARFRNSRAIEIPFGPQIDTVVPNL